MDVTTKLRQVVGRMVKLGMRNSTESTADIVVACCYLPATPGVQQVCRSNRWKPWGCFEISRQAVSSKQQQAAAAAAAAAATISSSSKQQQAAAKHQQADLGGSVELLSIVMSCFCLSGVAETPTEASNSDAHQLRALSADPGGVQRSLPAGFRAGIP